MESNTYPILILKINEQPYGIMVHDIVQIVDMVAITPLPLTISSIQGVINFRGDVVPIMDLRLRLRLPFQEYELNTPIILLDMKSHKIGVVSDEVEDIIEIPKEDVEENPAISKLGMVDSQTEKSLFSLAKIGETIIPIFQGHALLSEVEQEQIQQTLASL